MSAAGCSVGPHGPCNEPLHEGECGPQQTTETMLTEDDILAKAAQLRAEADQLEALAARPTRLFISGPAVSDDQKAAYELAATQLTVAGYDVVNPLDLPEAATWEARMRQTITAMLTCDGVAQLQGWPGSRSARIEVKLAREVGVPTAWVDVWVHEARKQRRETADGTSTEAAG